MPNITTVTNLQGETAGYAVTAGGSADVASGAGALETHKVNALLITNDSTSADAVVDVSFNDGNTNFVFANEITIPQGAALDVLSAPMYLNNGEKIVVAASSAAAVTAVASWENLTTVS